MNLKIDAKQLEFQIYIEYNFINAFIQNFALSWLIFFFFSFTVLLHLIHVLLCLLIHDADVQTVREIMNEEKSHFVQIISSIRSRFSNFKLNFLTKLMTYRRQRTVNHISCKIRIKSKHIQAYHINYRFMATSISVRLSK